MLRMVIWGVVIAAAALCAVSAQAQSERNNGGGGKVEILINPRSWSEPPRAAAMCQPHDLLTAIDKVICTDWDLLEKHNRFGRISRTVKIERTHREWLDSRAQCAGPTAVACLRRLYDARIKELEDAIAVEKQGNR
jgi:hypothetical protein